jgi:predicted nucleic acid-binding protein
VTLVFDTGPLLASFDRRDRYHEACRNLVEQTTETRLIIEPVLVELDYWIHARLYPGIFLTLLDDVIAGAYIVEPLLESDYVRIRDICDRYGDADVGFVDAALLAVVERLNETKLATLDRRHFGMMRPRHVDALLLLPE